ncbi:Hypothetical_protein [Hexamita inflata]|uniref:Hypothetical_protein n=1 Tax=Hexamita inflata TaxID=28002 RepID=A0AA86TRK7_9EUKA|nr:Hypothetical protein HINF_LOCUS11732 [Hexamita inflata]
MQPVNHGIRSKEDLLKHFGSSLKLEIVNSKQMKKLLRMNVELEVWEDASNRYLLFFNLEFVQRTKEFTFDRRGQGCYLYGKIRQNKNHTYGCYIRNSDFSRIYYTILSQK